jgi:hypothetical protein
MPAQQTDSRSTLLKVIHRIGGVFGITPHEDIWVYRDGLLAIVCGVALILATASFLEPTTTEKRLIPLGVILLCLLLAPGRRLIVLMGGCFIVSIRGVVVFALTGEAIALVLALVFGFATFVLLYFGARLEVGLGESASLENPPDRRHDSHPR